ncbi:MAG: hypothetical protein LUC83_06030 [Clostridiales bacterium]|nr:hypothetical protein [Clostridiales bacterium]
MTALGIIGILVGIVLLIWLTTKGIHVVILAPVCALIVMAMNFVSPVSAFTESYLAGMTTFITNNFLVLLFGSLFSVVFDKSGAAVSICNTIFKVFIGDRELRSNRGVYTCIIALIVISGVFMFGGIDGMVETITILPVCLAMAKRINISRNLVPALVFTTGCWAMCSPGVAQAVNNVAAQLCGTSSTACLVPGLIGAAVMIVITIFYLAFEMKRAIRLDHQFESLPTDPDMSEERKVPNFWVSIIPLVLIFVVYNVANVPLFVSLAAGLALAIILLLPYLLEGEKGKFGEFADVIEKGANIGVRISVLGASLVGFGRVVSDAPSFSPFINSLSNSGLPVLILCIIVIALVCAVTSNSNGGIQIGIEMTMPMAQAAGVSMAALHRVATFAAASLNTLPTNPGVLISCQLAGVKMKNGYRPIFVLSVVSPFIGAIVVALICMAFPGLAV